MKGGRPRYYVEEPTCETFTRLCEKTSCISSSLSHLTHLRKLAPHLTHFEPSPFFHPPSPVCLSIHFQGSKNLISARGLFIRGGDSTHGLYTCTHKIYIYIYTCTHNLLLYTCIYIYIHYIEVRGLNARR